jgi:DNA-binding NtrC family response regulator
MSPMHTGSPNLAVNALVVSPLEADFVSLCKILARSNWILNRVTTCREALALLQRRGISVVLCERDLPDGTWKSLLEATAELPNPPRLIVASRAADDRLWMEVLRAGGYDLLPVPFEAAEVFRVVSLAAQSWHRRLQPAYAPPKTPKLVSADPVVAR